MHLGVKSATLVPLAGSVTPQMLSTANVVYWSVSNNNIGIGNVTPTSLLTVRGTAALANTTITGFANVTTTIQGGSSLTIAGAASGITTLAAGNTTITGFANVSTDAYIGGNVGIGISSSSASKLNVNYEASFLVDNNNRGIVGWYDSDKRLGFGTINASNAYFNTMSVKDGKVGIGTTTPSGALDVANRGITKGSMPVGSVIQTQYVSSGTRVSTTYSGFSEPSTAYRVSITPSSASSMILLRYFVPIQVNSAANILQLFRAFRIVGGGSKDYALTSRGNTNGNRFPIAGMMTRPSNGYDQNDAITWQVEVIDFPNTTSAVTYGFETNPEGGNTTYYGYTASDNSTWGFDADIVIVAQEIAQ